MGIVRDESEVSDEFWEVLIKLLEYFVLESESVWYDQQRGP